MSDENVPAAGVVLRNESGEYLLVQEKWEKVRGLWNLPAGIQDKGETLPETATREALEEVGLVVKIIDPEPLYIKDSDRSGRALYSFEAKIGDGEITPQPEEILDAKWFSLQAIEKMLKDGKIRDEWAVDSIRKAEQRK